MFDRFEQHVIQKQFFESGKKYLLAFSSGVDSVVLAHLLIKYGVNFSMAHCNFNLRGGESEEDAQFAKQFAEMKDITFYYQSFDTKHHQKIEQTNTQLTARHLRYSWFRNLLNENAYSKIITAHHGSDNVETFMINAIRGSGAQGLKGISEIGEDVVRPLLPFSKNEIYSYATSNHLTYREDSSNYRMKYERNYIRAKVVPLLKNINPSLEQTFYNTARYLEETQKIADDYIRRRIAEITTTKGKDTLLDKEQLIKEPYLASILFGVLHPHGFNSHQLEQIAGVLKGEQHSGKVFYSSSHILLFDRAALILRKGETLPQDEVFYFQNIEELEKFKHLKLKVGKEVAFDFSNANQLAIDVKQLVFPLSIRRKQTGDRFKPFGMQQYKKLSDFFINNKLTEFDKRDIWILENGNKEIIWVMGFRSDERYRIRGNEVNLYKIEIV